MPALDAAASDDRSDPAEARDGHELRRDGTLVVDYGGGRWRLRWRAILDDDGLIDDLQAIEGGLPGGDEAILARYPLSAFPSLTEGPATAEAVAADAREAFRQRQLEDAEALLGDAPADVESRAATKLHGAFKMRLLEEVVPWRRVAATPRPQRGRSAGTGSTWRVNLDPAVTAHRSNRSRRGARCERSSSTARRVRRSF